MRTFLVLAILSLAAAACGSDGTTGGGDDDTMMPDSGTTGGGQPAFSIESKEVTLQNPGDEFTYCYYFHTPNDKPVVVNKWASHMTTGSHHIIYFFGNDNQPADGTIDDCGGSAASLVPVWIYSAQTADAELDLPSDDGTGKPLGMVIPAHQAGYLQLHYINLTEGPLTVKAKVDVYTLADGTPYTQTAAFITYNAQISIPPHAVNHLESQTCTVPSGATFWLASTHAHKQAVKTEILDGSSVVFSSTDWEHPGAKLWNGTPFYKFSSGKLTYNCTYNNTGETAPPDNENDTIKAGQSALTNEMCMASGYFFPATAAKFCLNSAGPF